MNSTASSNNPIEHYDIVIIGGGIYGSAVLWEAAHRGLSALLLEKNDFGSATSANSLKTIHGGIRYLQQLNMKKAIESDREKVILRKIAPNIIEPLTCCLPVQNNSSKSYVSYWLGATFFNFLSRLNPLGSGRHPSLFSSASTQKSLDIFHSGAPRLNKFKPTSFMVWQDAQAKNSERLSLSFITSAKNSGASALNYCEVTSVERDKVDEKYRVFTATNNMYTADIIVDCTANNQFSKQHKLISNLKKNTGYVAGINLILDLTLSDWAFALPSQDASLGKQGMLFFSPWKNSTLAGTWYFKQSDINCRNDVTDHIINRCVRDIESALIHHGLDAKKLDIKNKILNFHLGFLPANTKQANPEKSLINRASIETNGQGIYCLEGNKYTTARLNAKKLIDRLAKQNTSISSSRSHQIVLAGADKFRAKDESASNTILPDRYGDQYHKMINQFQNSSNSAPSDVVELVPNSTTIYKVEIDYFIRDPSVTSLADILYRRINHNTALPIDSVTVEWCAQRMANKLNWSKEQLDNNIRSVINIEQDKHALSHD